MSLFSIVVVHYQGTISQATFERGIASLHAQTFRDFEILCYHDGPLLNENPQPVPIKTTDRRHNDFGHSLRDIGIREARGEYILHFNADNVLYPYALAALAKEIQRPPCMFEAETRRPLDVNNIVIFPVLMCDMQRYMETNVRFHPGSGRAMILTGNPPALGLIDCMQLVMKRSLWLAEGGWRDKRSEADGYMYPGFCQKYGYRTVTPVLGEHF